jgi:hypothetical protein
VLPRHVDGGFHIVCQDDELRWSMIVMAAKTYDVDLSHSGRKIARNRGESKGEASVQFPAAISVRLSLDGIFKATDNMRLQRHGKGGNGCQEKKH